MSKKKAYYRFSPLAFISGILCLLIAGLIVAFIFLPVFSFKSGSEPAVIFKGLDYNYFGLKVIFKQFADPFTAFSQNFQAYVDANGPNFLFKIIAQFHDFFELGIVALFIVSAIFAVIEAILGIFWFITGRLVFPSSSKLVAWLITGFFIASLGLFAGYLFVYSLIVKELGESAAVSFSFYPIYIAIALFVLSLALNIIYAIGYKGRDLGTRDEERNRRGEFDIPHDEPEVPQTQPVVVPVPAPEPAPQPQPQPEPIQTNPEPIHLDETPTPVEEERPQIQIEIPQEEPAPNEPSIEEPTNNDEDNNQ